MDQMESIHFGTDGWRGVIAREFTYDNVARVGEAVARYLKSQERQDLDAYKRWNATPTDWQQGVVVGYDMRFQARAFAIHLARVLNQRGIPAWVTPDAVPTPVVAHGVVQRNAALGLMVTASHNPPDYLGVKIKTELGGAAGPEITGLVEQFLPNDVPEVDEAGMPDEVDVRTPYLQRLAQLIDIRLLQKAPLRVVVDAMHGSARGYVAALLEDLQIPYVQVRHERNPEFGGTPPEPVERYVTPLKAVVAAEKARRRDNRLLVGLVTDGDGDRVAAADEHGHYVDPHRCYALLFRHLLQKGLSGRAVKSFTLTDMAAKLAAGHDMPIDEVPVGFKHISEKLLTEDVLIGGEESGGIAVKGHIPERDGVLIGLLLLEAVAREGKLVSRLVDALMAEVGAHHFQRHDLHLEERLEAVERIADARPETFAGRPVREIETLDGLKLRFDDGWLLFRASGTEPVLRVYCEMDDPQKVTELINEGVKVARGERELWS
ncbi:MAG: phosphoglucomutase/phosphomannomutase family protein [Candidatus Bipolaricaulia bacterium]